MFIEAGVADDVVARGEHLFKEVLGNLPVAALAGDLVHARRANDLGNVRICVQALQFIAAPGQRIEKAGLLEEAGGVEVPLLLRQRRQVHEDLVHAAVLGAQHPLTLIGH